MGRLAHETLPAVDRDLIKYSCIKLLNELGSTSWLIPSILGARGFPSISTIIISLSFVHSVEGVITMNNKHSVFEALGAMSLLVAAGTVAMCYFDK
jgi:hypothetical protein